MTNSFRPRYQTTSCVSCIAGGSFYHWATREAQNNCCTKLNCGRGDNNFRTLEINWSQQIEKCLFMKNCWTSGKNRGLGGILAWALPFLPPLPHPRQTGSSCIVAQSQQHWLQTSYQRGLQRAKSHTQECWQCSTHCLRKMGTLTIMLAWDFGPAWGKRQTVYVQRRNEMMAP